MQSRSQDTFLDVFVSKEKIEVEYGVLGTKLLFLAYQLFMKY